MILLWLVTFVAAAQQAPATTNPDAASQASIKDPQGASLKNAPKPDVTQQDAAEKASQSGSPAPGQSIPGNNSTQGKVAGTSNDRLFYTLPNFLTLEKGDKVPPLTAKEKFKVVALGTFDPVQYPWWGIISAISQAENSEPAYGQGWAAYGKRYGTTAADSTIENFMVGAVFSSILHQDPRFYRSSQDGFEHRTWYAVTRILVTQGDSGSTQFNCSEVFGAAFAAAVSTYSYHPKSTYVTTPTNPHMFVPSDRTLLNTTSVWGTQIGLDAFTLVVKEFWPDLHRKLSHKPQPNLTKADKNPQSF